MKGGLLFTIYGVISLFATIGLIIVLTNFIDDFIFKRFKIEINCALLIMISTFISLLTVLTIIYHLI